MSLDKLSPAQILGRIRYDPLTKMGSVLDVIQLVTGCEKSVTSRNFVTIQDTFPEVNQKVMNFKFPGQGQRLTPVAFLKDLIEIAWLCPGRHAKDFRRTGAVTLCRALGGDLSLIDEIRQRRAEVTEDEQDALLAGTGVTTAEANGYAVSEKAASERYKVETAMMQARADQLQLETKMAAHRYMLAMVDQATEARDKLMYSDAARNYFVTHWLSDKPTEQEHPITISEVARQLGYRLQRGDESRIGREVARMYREHYGAEPPKHSQFVDGAVRQVNSYTTSHMGIVQQAISHVMA